MFFGYDAQEITNCVPIIKIAKSIQKRLNSRRNLEGCFKTKQKSVPFWDSDSGFKN
jgi:hypothetical protein